MSEPLSRRLSRCISCLGKDDRIAIQKAFEDGVAYFEDLTLELQKAVLAAEIKRKDLDAAGKISYGT